MNEQTKRIAIALLAARPTIVVHGAPRLEAPLQYGEEWQQEIAERKRRYESRRAAQMATRQWGTE